MPFLLGNHRLGSPNISFVKNLSINFFNNALLSLCNVTKFLSFLQIFFDFSNFFFNCVISFKPYSCISASELKAKQVQKAQPLEQTRMSVLPKIVHQLV